MQISVKVVGECVMKITKELMKNQLFIKPNSGEGWHEARKRIGVVGQCGKWTHQGTSPFTYQQFKANESKRRNTAVQHHDFVVAAYFISLV